MSSDLVKLTLMLIMMSSPVEACHRFSVWKYPYPQRCAVTPERVWHVEFVLPDADPLPPQPKPEVDIPLPSLEDMVFPPDATGDAGDRLKGIGLLRELRGTN
jgi:hypothetical protein